MADAVSCVQTAGQFRRAFGLFLLRAARLLGLRLAVRPGRIPPSRSGAASWRCAVVLASLILFTAAAAPEQQDKASLAVLGTLRAGAQDLSTRSEGAEDGLFTWASWTEGTPDQWTNRLVLLRAATSNNAAITWSIARPDGYGAVLRPTPWNFCGRLVLMLQYQYGAAYTRVELHAAGRTGGERSATSFSMRFSVPTAMATSGRPTPVRAGTERIADHPLEPADVGLD